MSAHATAPTALGTFFAYPVDAAGAVEPYWRDAGGTRVRMTAACRRAFLATVEALVERAVVPANLGDVPADQSVLAAATFSVSLTRPYSLIDLGPWADGTARDAIGPLLRRGCPYGVWVRLVTLVWSLFRTTRSEYGLAVVLSWQGGMLDANSAGFIDADDGFWANNIYSRDWAAGAAYDPGAGYEDPVLPWGPYLGGGGGSAVESALQNMFDGLMAPVSIGGGSGELCFVEEALNLPLDVMRMDGATPGNWFTNSSAYPVGGVTLRRSAAAWGVIQAMLAQMRFTHLQFPYEITYEHTEETREVLREVGWDWTDMDWTCDEISDTTTTSTSLYYNQIQNVRGYGAAGGTAPEVTLDFRVDNSDPGELAVLALGAPPSDVGPDGPYMVVGRTFLQFCTVASGSPETWSKTANRQYVSAVDNVRVDIDAYPAVALRDYVDEYGPVHFAGSLRYENTTTQETWAKYSLRPETGDQDLVNPVTDHASWFMSQVPGVTLPQISPFSQSVFDAAVADYWAGMTAVYPNAPNVTVRGVPMYFPVGFYGYNQQLQYIYLDSTDNYWKGQIRLGFGNVEAVFPTEGAEAYRYEAQCAPTALAGYMWQFKAMPTE